MNEQNFMENVANDLFSDEMSEGAQALLGLIGLLTVCAALEESAIAEAFKSLGKENEA